jgi:predicted AAA+ superfamily ATPase
MIFNALGLGHHQSGFLRTPTKTHRKILRPDLVEFNRSSRQMGVKEGFDYLLRNKSNRLNFNHKCPSFPPRDLGRLEDGSRNMKTSKYLPRLRRGGMRASGVMS